jgi:hypothetical protein
MPLLRSLIRFTFGFYKDAAPTRWFLDALPKCPVEII